MAVFKIKGYAVLRADRTTGRAADKIKGGGVVTLIRESIQYTINKAPVALNDHTTDCLHTTLHLKKRDVEVVNAYIPPIRAGAEDHRQQCFNANCWPTSKNTIILADVNAHTREWDENAEEDERGRDIWDWMTDSNFAAANDGTATRINPSNGTGTSPDVTLIHSSQVKNITWRTGCTLSSDHLPILVTLSGCRAPKATDLRPPSYNYKKAKWLAFQQLVEAGLAEVQHSNCSEDLARLNNAFRDVLLAAAAETIPRGRRHKYTPWWTPEAEAAISNRNHLRKQMMSGDPDSCASFSKAAKEATRIIAEGKRSAWRRFAGDLNFRTKATVVWRTIKAIDGRTGQPKPSASLRSGDRAITTDKGKANAFCKEYAQVSRCHEDLQQRNFTKRTMDRCRLQCDCGVYCADLTTSELCKAIAELKCRKAPGADGITNEMIQHLPPSGIYLLLHLANLSWRLKRCPGNWTSATIIPILKSGKPADQLGSYRPISLTSVISKVVERMVNNRLNFFLEDNNKLSPAQAGFRKMRSTEDQLLHATQSISDGFQQRPPLRTCMVLVDFTRAFDNVWRSALIQKMLEKEVPRCITQWVKAFLADRRAKVNFNGVVSKSKAFKAGVPQGAVISPTLFSIFIDDILDDVQTDQRIHASMYADDLAIWCQSNDIRAAEESMQKAINKLQTWAERWKMTISKDKTEVTFFSTDPHEARYHPKIFLGTDEVKFNPTPTLLGVVLDRLLTFRTHVNNIKGKLDKRLRILSALKGTSWGAAKDAKIVYRSYVRPVAEYCCGAWLPSTKATNRATLDRCQNRAARIITGCCRSSPTELLHCEADVVPFSVIGEVATAVAYEKAMRLPVDNPRAAAASESVRRRLKSQPSWREDGKQTSTRLHLDGLPRAKLSPTPPVPPWTSPPNVNFIAAAGEKGTAPHQKKAAALQSLASLPRPDVEIFTDGSAVNSNTRGGAGCVIRNNTVDPPTSHTIRTPAGRFTSSYRAEQLAFASALDWLDRFFRGAPPREIRICTDSRSLVQALARGLAKLTDATSHHIWRRLQDFFPSGGAHLTAQWIPAHVGIAGNE